jgi:hypothetical protein
MEFVPATPVPPVARRPVGVIIAAALLALSGCCLLMMAGIMFAIGFAMRHSAAPHRSLPLPHLPIAGGICLLLLASLCGAVVSGLVKRRNWARTGILLIGSLQAPVCLAAAVLYYLISKFNFPSPSGGPPLDPGLLKGVMYCLSAGFLLAAAAGAWWVVYFNRRRVHLWFCPEADLAAEASGDPYPGRPKKLSGDGAVETLLIALAVLLLASAMKSILYAGLHFPVFFAGDVFRGHVAVSVWLTLAVLNTGVAIGLLLRDKTAWYLAFVLEAHALLAWIDTLLPQTRQRMLAYQHEVQHALVGDTAVPHANALLEKPLLFVFSMLGLVFMIAIVWLLIRARPLFFPKPDA